MHLHVFNKPAEVVKDFADLLKEKINRADRFYLALSGGSTPRLLFDLLASESGFKEGIKWHKVHFFWSDERCVSPDSRESNFGMTKAHLFDHINVPQANIHRIVGENTPEIESARYGKEIEDLVPMVKRLPRFDMVMLGMGTDGHTASLFPNQMELLKARTPCVVATHPESGQERISLSARVINNAQIVAFLVMGDDKKKKIGEIFSKKRGYKKLPASHIIPVSKQIYWFLDKAAFMFKPPHT